MIPNELLEAIKRLDDDDKLELVQLLIDDLKLVGTAYEIYTPFGNEAAARLLLNELQRVDSSSQPEVE